MWTGNDLSDYFITRLMKKIKKFHRDSTEFWSDCCLDDTKMSREDTLAYARKVVAMSYYVNNGASLGYCAQIAGMPKVDFIKYLSENKVSIFHFDNEEEMMRLSVCFRQPNRDFKNAIGVRFYQISIC